MTLPHLNPDDPPREAEARGYMAPYVRVATHLGYCIAWIGATSDEEWNNAHVDPLSHDGATVGKVQDDLRESYAHLANNVNMLPTAFVGGQQVAHMHDLSRQVSDLIDYLPEQRSDALIEMQTLANNLAYAAAQFERHATGNTDVDEGRNA